MQSDFQSLTHLLPHKIQPRAICQSQLPKAKHLRLTNIKPCWIFLNLIHYYSHSGRETNKIISQYIHRLCLDPLSKTLVNKMMSGVYITGRKQGCRTLNVLEYKGFYLERNHNL